MANSPDFIFLITSKKLREVQYHYNIYELAEHKVHKIHTANFLHIFHIRTHNKTTYILHPITFSGNMGCSLHLEL